MKIQLLIPPILLLLACATTTPVASPQLEGVTITFVRFGGAVHPADQRMGESGEIAAAHKPGKDPWLRLTNGSNRVLALTTYSTYMKPPIQWFRLSDGRKVIALEDGMEIALPFGVESRKGAREDAFGPYGDMFWTSFLPPGRSVLFSVPPAALRKQRKVFVTFEDAEETHGPQYRVSFQQPVR